MFSVVENIGHMAKIHHGMMAPSSTNFSQPVEMTMLSHTQPTASVAAATRSSPMRCRDNAMCSNSTSSAAKGARRTPPCAASSTQANQPACMAAKLIHHRRWLFIRTLLQQTVVDQLVLIARHGQPDLHRLVADVQPVPAVLA